MTEHNLEEEEERLTARLRRFAAARMDTNAISLGAATAAKDPKTAKIHILYGLKKCVK